MKKAIFIALIIMTVPVFTNAQWPSNVTVIDMGEGSTAEAQGDLAKGEIIKDLSWAWNSANACFPSTQSSKFKGNHVFYAVTMPPRCEMFISVAPSDGKADMSIYAYRLGASSYDLVPELERCITCEADHKHDGNWKNATQTAERKVSFQNPGTETYNILIGVTAPAGVTSGAFSLKIKLTQ